ncbi:MAG: hypothetical protein WCJ25_03370 [Candidatus Moraniibacteriota bacterium]
MSNDFRTALNFSAAVFSVLMILVSARTVFGESDDDDGGSGKTVTTYVTQYVTRQVSKVVTVTPLEYQTDTDGDGLVDAIDPDPKRRQQDYFTDSDGDSVPDAFDRHPGEDDLAYSETNTDLDGNGIIDAYEGR